MRRFGLILPLIFLPLGVQAQCLDEGYTVVFINGIFNTREEAEVSKLALKHRLGFNYKNESLNVLLGYNATHIEGLGDLAQVAAQGFGGTVSTYDRDTILMQLAPELTTRKVLLVGHSQGTFYSNDIYSYFLSNGEPKESVGVYNVATPANFVAGGGKYITSEADTIIALFAEYAKRTGARAPLVANIDLGLGGAMGNGHNFVHNYLAYGGERIVSDIQGELSRLKATWKEETAGCFSPPDNTLSYKASGVFFAIVDPTASGIKIATITAANGVTLAVQGVKSGLAAVGSFFAGTQNTAATSTPTNLPGSHDVVRALYGSSVTEKDLNEFNQNQGGAVALAFSPPPPKEIPTGEVKGASTENFQPLIPPTNLIPGGTPGFGGGGGNPPAAASASQTDPPVAETPVVEETPTPREEDTPPADDTVPPAEDPPIEETPPEEIPPTPTYTTLLAQPDASVLGEFRNVRPAYFPGQKLGNGLTGTVSSIVYKVSGTNIQPLLEEGWGSVEIRDCYIDNGSYAPIGSCASVAFGPPSLPITLSENGESAIVRSVLNHPYTFDPSHYYWMRFFINEEMALYGSASATAYQGSVLLGAWIGGLDFINPVLDENGVVDWAFRMCETDACEL